jgi:hypothetical protein
LHLFKNQFIYSANHHIFVNFAEQVLKLKDDTGLYYYPNPSNKKIRMYVCLKKGQLCFRMWDNEDSTLWETHGWVPYEAIKQAGEIYQGTFDHHSVYDLAIAQALLKEKH